MSIEEIESQIEKDFSAFATDSDTINKIEYVINLGKKLPPLDDKYKTQENRIRGCQSNVWLRAVLKNGKVYFTADSDTIFTKGLIALLIRVVSEHTPDEIINSKLDFMNRIGLRQHLTPGRNNGFVYMAIQMRQEAEKFKNIIK